jgi:hypothetical protein
MMSACAHIVKGPRTGVSAMTASAGVVMFSTAAFYQV